MDNTFNDYVVTVDGADFKMPKPIGRLLWSHKLLGPSLRYEIVVVVKA